MRLVARYQGSRLDKTYQCSNWAGPLSSDQLECLWHHLNLSENVLTSGTDAANDGCSALDVYRTLMQVHRGERSLECFSTPQEGHSIIPVLPGLLLTTPPSQTRNELGPRLRKYPSTASQLSEFSPFNNEQPYSVSPSPAPSLPPTYVDTLLPSQLLTFFYSQYVTPPVSFPYQQMLPGHYMPQPPSSTMPLATSWGHSPQPVNYPGMIPTGYPITPGIPIASPYSWSNPGPGYFVPHGGYTQQGQPSNSWNQQQFVAPYHSQH